MRSILLLTLVVALALGVSAAWATTSVDDGLSFNATTGGTGYFNGTTGALLSPTAAGWNTQGDPRNLYVSTKGGYSFRGVYDYDDYKWIPCEGTPETDWNISVTCDVEMWCYETLAANEVYFHFGQYDATPQEAIIGGHLDTNSGQYVGLTKTAWGSGDKAKADNLAFLADGFGRTNAWFIANQPTNVPTPIPVTYKISENGGASWTTGSWSGGNNNQDWGYWWLIAGGEEGAHDYQFSIGITPKSHQEDGRYYLDPSWCVAPVI